MPKLITPNPESINVIAIRKYLDRLEKNNPSLARPEDLPEDKKTDWETLRELIDKQCEMVSTFDERHVLHQKEQRESAKRLAETKTSYHELYDELYPNRGLGECFTLQEGKKYNELDARSWN